MREKKIFEMDTKKIDFPIVGIGASAGGLEALVSFLGNVPENCGLAFIIVQHMEPKRKDILVGLLQSATHMKVVQVNENTYVEPNCVYVIPPNKNMSIENRTMHLFDYISLPTQRMPVDFFFRSLAHDQQERSIVVILSGMGSDGTMGIKAIKEQGGVVFVQDPSSAKFDGMPISAIEGGLADVISPVETLPAKIIAYLEDKVLINGDERSETNKGVSSFNKILMLLRSDL